MSGKVKSAVVGALAAGTLASTVLTSASPAHADAIKSADSSAAVGGRVCFVSAPFGAYLQGHVGWLARAEDGRRWYAGAQEGKTPQKQWVHGPVSWSDAVTRLKKNPEYRTVRCRNTPDGSAINAVREFNKRQWEPYNPATSNCLTRAVSAFKGYSIALNGLHSGKGIAPNTYLSLLPSPWSKPRAF